MQPCTIKARYFLSPLFDEKLCNKEVEIVRLELGKMQSAELLRLLFGMWHELMIVCFDQLTLETNLIKLCLHAYHIILRRKNGR